MKFSYFTRISIITLACASLSSAQQAVVKKENRVTTDHTVIVPPHVTQSAQTAVQNLGNKIKAGDFTFGYESMYGRYKRRQEKLFGKDQLKAQILGAKDKMIKMGATIESFTAQKPSGFFKVYPMIKPEIKAKIATGEITKTTDKDIFYHWMIITPTTQVWAFHGQKGGKIRYLKREQFQIAIAKETDFPGQEQWSFIGQITEQQLRSIFPSLPANLLLPKLTDSEIKK